MNRAPGANGRERGIAVLLVVGLLGLLGLLALSLLRLGSNAASTGRETARQAAADSAAESGLHYAAGRLMQTADSVPPDARRIDNAGDDWSCRDFSSATAELPLPLSLNPSYNHGERWRDGAGGEEGVYEAGTDDIGGSPDLDGNGRFSSWSGRLRSGAGPAYFSLRVQSEPSLACVNSGELCAPSGDQDLDGVLNADDPDFSTDRNMDGAGQPVGNGVPDWRDPDYVGNRHIVNLLDNLGAILGLSTSREEPYWPGDDPIDPVLGRVETSTLGRQVVAARPRGGYVSVDQLEPVLGAADHGAAAPFLSARGETVPVAFQEEGFDKARVSDQLFDLPEVRYEFHARIDFNNAPVELIRASLRYLSSSGRGSEGGGEQVNAFFRLQKDEADAVAAILAGNRPIRTWPQLLATLVDRVPDAVYQQDPFYDQAEELWAIEGNGLPRLKQELILAQWDADWMFHDAFGRRRSSLDVEREPAAGFLGPDRTRVIQVAKEHLTGPLNTAPFAQNGVPLDGEPVTGIPGRMTTEFALASGNGSFAFVSAGWSGSGSARAGAASLSLRGEPLRLASQHDFEHPGASPSSPWRRPGGQVEAVSPVQVRDHIHSTPRFPFSAPGRGNYPAGAQTGYPRAHGALQLGARRMPDAELAAPGCVFALPFDEDGLPGPGNRWDPGDWFDNVGDPIDRPPDPAAYVVHADLHANGIWPSPAGQRQMKDFAVVWEQMPFAAGAGGIAGGTLSFWACRTGANENDQWFNWSDEPENHVVVEYPFGTVYVSYLQIQFLNHTGQVRVVNLAGSAYAGTFTTDPPDPGLRKCSWHHVALTFTSLGGDLSGVLVYLDGTLKNPGGTPYPVRLHPDRPPSSSGMRVRFYGPADDVRFFSSSLPAGGVREMARSPRFHADPTGTDPALYRSPRFRFDPVLFPDGAVPCGAAWNAFIPEGTGGSFTFEVTAYDETGEIGSSGPIPYDGSQAPQAAFRLPACRSFDVTVRMDTDPAAWPLAEGEPVLRDAPLLEEFRVFYALRRPRWRSYEAR